MIYDLEPFLDKYEIKYNTSKRGNQMISCPNPEHDDPHPSTSVHLDKGVWNCQACGEGGSAVDLVMIVEGVEVREALRIAENVAGPDGREVSPGGDGGRNSVGLPRGSRYRNKPKGSVSPWAGFRT